MTIGILSYKNKGSTKITILVCLQTFIGMFLIFSQSVWAASQYSVTNIGNFLPSGINDRS
jgi:hypothetical protein